MENTMEDIPALIAELRRGVPTRRADDGGLSWEYDTDAAAAIMDRAAAALSVPHIAMRPKLYPDGNMWCALYGDDLQSGCAGFGDTPEAAMIDFDANWATMSVTTDPSIKEKLMGEFDRMMAAFRIAP
jgi:hypothetical protein